MLTNRRVLVTKNYGYVGISFPFIGRILREEDNYAMIQLPNYVDGLYFGKDGYHELRHVNTKLGKVLYR